MNSGCAQSAGDVRLGQLKFSGPPQAKYTEAAGGARTDRNDTAAAGQLLACPPALTNARTAVPPEITTGGGGALPAATAQEAITTKTAAPKRHMDAHCGRGPPLKSGLSARSPNRRRRRAPARNVRWAPLIASTSAPAPLRRASPADRARARADDLRLVAEQIELSAKILKLPPNPAARLAPTPSS